MKPFLISILLSLFCFSADCQTQTIPKTYSYFSEKEEWNLRIFDFKTFELLVKRNDDNSFFVLDGNCILTDSTIHLAFNSSVNRDLLMRDTSYGPNVKEFIRGNTFKRVNDYIIPKTSPVYTKMQDGSKPGIHGSYFQQVELHMGGTKVQFENKNRYTLTESFCTGQFIEKGQYSQLGNIVSLKSNKKGISRSSVLMDKGILFATEDFLISRKIQPGTQPDRFASEEVFLYFFRL